MPHSSAIGISALETKDRDAVPDSEGEVKTNDGIDGMSLYRRGARCAIFTTADHLVPSQPVKDRRNNGEAHRAVLTGERT